MSSGLEKEQYIVGIFIWFIYTFNYFKLPLFWSNDVFSYSEVNMVFWQQLLVVL